MSDLIVPIVGLIQSMGYAGVFATMFLVFVFFPIPSQVVLIPAGYLAHGGHLSMTWVLLSGASGGLAGALASYYLAALMGKSVVLTYRKFLFIDENKLHRLEGFFERYGVWFVAIGFMTPAIGHLASLPAGFARMDVKKYIPAAFVGSLMWTLLMASIGYFFGSYRSGVFKSVEEVVFGVILVALLIVYLVFRTRRER
ncbi:MAG: DedA family protein [Sulfuricurvum sp.]